MLGSLEQVGRFERAGVRVDVRLLAEGGSREAGRRGERWRERQESAESGAHRRRAGVAVEKLLKNLSLIHI